MPQCALQGLRHSLAAIADVEAQLLQSSLMELHGTSLPLGRCLAASILYDRFSKRRVLLQYADQVEHGLVLMSHETSHPVVPALAGVVGPLCTAERRVILHVPHWRRVQRRRAPQPHPQWVGRRWDTAKCAADVRLVEIRQQVVETCNVRHAVADMAQAVCV